MVTGPPYIGLIDPISGRYPETEHGTPASYMRGFKEIALESIRQSAITSHSIGVPELTRLLEVVPSGADLVEYKRAAVEGNAFALATDSGRVWRFKTLRRLYLFRSDSTLFRALRDLWAVDEDGRPLLAALCAMATDTVFRASASVIVGSTPGDDVAMVDFADAIELQFPGAYANSTLTKAANNAYASWQQSGHLAPPESGRKRRQQVTCSSADVAYALFLSHLQDSRGQALFDTVWTRVLDTPRSQLYDLAFAASQRGMLEYRNAGGVVEVGFRELLRPVQGELL